MYVLVDYSNVRGRLGKKDLQTKVRELTETICGVLDEIPHRLNYRLYGGWYEKETLTRKAQEITIEIQNEYPELYQPIVNPGKEKKARIRISAELAYSMLVDPNHHLVRTVRQRKTYRSVRVQSPKSNGCERDDCFLKGIKGFFSKGRCTHHECDLKADDLLNEKREQKLVDTMLSADLLHLVSEGHNTVVVVTSDDDLIPAVRQALLNDMQIIHIHTGPHQQTPTHYVAPELSNYIQASVK
jgi:uncharacterized LabA/DUF88 family protein